MSITNGVFLFASVIVTWGVVQHFFCKVKSLCSTRGIHTVSGICMMLIIIAGCAISSHSPMLMDAMTLTATGENRPGAIGNEIWFSGYTIDGKEYVAGKDLEIENGKWFWIGENYCWRDKRDPHQPEGVTSAVTVKIPVGKERTLHFDGAPQRGKIKVEIGDVATVFDTYHETPNTFKYGIAPSARYRIFLNYMIRFLVYGLSIFLMMYIGYWVLRKKYCNPQWWEVYSGRVGCAAIAVFIFVLMMYFANGTEFWYDELAQIESSVGSIKRLLKLHLMGYDVTPPLYSVFAWLWYLVIPYGERWILFLPILFTAFSCYVLGRIGEKIGGRLCGILSAAVMGCSYAVWHSCAYNHRAYSFLLFFTVCSLYMHIRMRENRNTSSLLLYNLVLTGLVMSHYFGALVAVGLLCVDAAFLYKRKLELLKRYAVPGSCCLIWIFLFYQMSNGLKNVELPMSWYPVPTIAHVFQLLYVFSSWSEILFTFFVCGIIFSLRNLLLGRNSVEKNDYRPLLVWMICFPLMLIFVYGNYVNSRSTMWEERYFTILFPGIYLLTALGAVEILRSFYCRFTRMTPAVLIGCGFLLLHLLVHIPQGVSQGFRSSADYLYATQTDYIFDRNTVIITTTNVPNAWNEYYISRKGRRDKLNVIKICSVVPFDANNDEEIYQIHQKYKKVYLQYSQIAFPDTNDPVSIKLQNILNEHYALEEDRKDIQLKMYSLKKQ